MKNALFLLLTFLPLCLFSQDEEKKLFTELTYGYDLSTKDSYKRRIISEGTNTIGIIQNFRLGANIGYPIRPKFYLISGIKANINSNPYAIGDSDNY